MGYRTIKFSRNQTSQSNYRTTIREVAEDVSISFCSFQAILPDVLGMKSVAAKIVPKLLNFEEKQCRMDIV